jgi:CheY-like chemotaxis protein
MASKLINLTMDYLTPDVLSKMSSVGRGSTCSGMENASDPASNSSNSHDGHVSEMRVPGHRPRVFVVDDKQVIAHTLAIILRQAGYDASPFYEAKLALEAAKLAAPDLLLTDVVISDLDGIELAGRMTDRCPGCKVLLFSGQATTASLLEDGRAANGSFEVLRKPLHPNDLLA